MIDDSTGISRRPKSILDANHADRVMTTHRVLLQAIDKQLPRSQAMASQLIPWIAFPELDDLRSRFNQAYGGLFDGDNGALTPAIDIERNKNHLTVRADLPGVKPDQLEIKVQDGVLTISGKLEEHEDKKEKTYVRHERRYGSFMRSITLPDGVDPSKVTAKTSDGVVEITIPIPHKSKKEAVTITPTAA
jgi:HSP20 family protein